MQAHQMTPARACVTMHPTDEFAAHAGAVNCLKIGRKSSGVLVTGGDDRKVNVWAIGKPNAILVRGAAHCMAGSHASTAFPGLVHSTPSCNFPLPTRTGKVSGHTATALDYPVEPVGTHDSSAVCQF
jgi:hypothetical protein